MHAPDEVGKYPERLSFRMSTKAKAKVAAEAAEAGKSNGEVVRDLVEQWAKGEPSNRTVLAEVTTVRKILASFFLKTNRDLMAAGKFDDDMLMELVEGADKEKWNQADRKILEARQG